jgi:hypothetical protein
MTDWKLIAKARGLDPADPQVEKHVSTMSQLESILLELKKKLPDDGEPAPVFRPVLTKREGAN